MKILLLLGYVMDYVDEWCYQNKSKGDDELCERLKNCGHQFNEADSDFWRALSSHVRWPTILQMTICHCFVLLLVLLVLSGCCLNPERNEILNASSE